MPNPDIHAAWLRPAAAAAGLLLLWQFESLQRLPLRPRHRSRLLHAVRNLTLGALGAGLLRVVAAGLTAAVLEWSATAQSGLLFAASLRSELRLVAAVVLMDFWTWSWHRACHRIPFLWRFHRLHHSDPAMDVTTAFRFHPGELLISAFARLPLLVVLGLTATELLLYETLLLASSQYQHAALSCNWWDRALRWLLVTPSVHRVHHSPQREFTNSNYASVLNCWDRLFGTWREPQETGDGHNTGVPECGLEELRGEGAWP
jgi:sterol desaturase/sphingolipid hydroxylase (fatty acid hydroxylase superfamily)